MSSLVVGFIGSIGSGKSTISRALADELNWPLVSFGDYVRSVAKERGMDYQLREVLQNVGISLINQGWSSFCTSVMKQANWQPGDPLLIDGIRHEESINCLQELVKPSKLVLIFIDLDEATQKTRLQSRNNLDGEKLDQIETHSTEREVKTGLKSKCNLIINGDLAIKETTNRIISWLTDHADWRTTSKRL